MTNHDIDFPVSRQWADWYDNRREEILDKLPKSGVDILPLNVSWDGETLAVGFSVNIEDADGRRWECKKYMRAQWMRQLSLNCATWRDEPTFTQKAARNGRLWIEVKGDVIFL